MQRLFLARHGETIWNRTDRLQGQTDIELSQAGRRHAELLLTHLRQEQIDAIYTSTLRRAIETARPLAEHFGLPLLKRSELREIGFGVLEGKGPGDPDPAVREMLRKRLADKSGFVPPGGESYREVEGRVFPLIRELHRKHAGKTVLIVGHRAVNRVILGFVLGLSPREYVEFDQHHGTLYEVRFGERAELITHMV
jgi:broad specificity phosphatase PhoE